MTERAEDVIDVALRIAAALESVGAAYFVGGSLASSLHGEPRATNDIDFVIDVAFGKVEALAAALGTFHRTRAGCLPRCPSLPAGGSSSIPPARAGRPWKTPISV